MKSEIPNIYGTFRSSVYAVEYSGAFYPAGTYGYVLGNLGGFDTSYDFNATRCSDRYGSYTEVNPLYTSCKFIISYA